MEESLRKPTRAQAGLLNAIIQRLEHTGDDTVKVVDLNINPNLATVEACVASGWLKRASSLGVATVRFAPLHLTDAGRDAMANR